MDTQIVNQSTTDKIIGMLEALAKKLGTTGEYLWGVLVKQGYLELYTDIAYITVAFIVAITCITTAMKEFINNERVDIRGDWTKGKFALVLFCLVLGGLSLFTGLITFNGLQVPEAYALERILEVLK